MKYPVAGLGDVVRVSEPGCHTAAQTDHPTGLWNSLSVLTGRWKSLGAFPFGDSKGMAASVRKTSLKFDGIEYFFVLMLWQIRILYREMSTLSRK